MQTLGNVSNRFPGTIWRFLPGLDAQVDSLYVRDLDSVITNREAEAVRQFSESSMV